MIYLSRRGSIEEFIFWGIMTGWQREKSRWIITNGHISKKIWLFFLFYSSRESV